MNHPYFNITAMLDISFFKPFLKTNNLPFTPSLVFIITHVANEIKEFRWRVRGNQVIEHERVHPSFAVETEESDVFSFCQVDYSEHAKTFIERAVVKMEDMRLNPSMEDDLGRDDYLFLSANPWMHFTSMQHAMQSHPGDSVPRIVWGKYQQNGNRLDLPLSVQVHHAVVDGRHVGRYFEQTQDMLNSANWLAR